MPLVLLNKPFRVLSQFTTDSDKRTLASFVATPDVYAAGRLDFDSEGLLLLTDSGRLKSAIASPTAGVDKRYWVQVEGEARERDLARLRRGITLKDGPASAVQARLIQEPAGLWPRTPPIRVRQSVPDCWLEVVIREGRNRQVRRMTAAVGLPTLRLIRHSIGPWQLGALQPGESRAIDNGEAMAALRG